MECVFCVEKLSLFTETRKIPCGHVACNACFCQEEKASGNIQCPTCRLEFKTVNGSYLEEVKLDPRTPPSHSLEPCDVCHQKLANVFCVTCQMLLCSTHKEEDQAKADSCGARAHYQVKIKQFMKSKESYYKRHYCRVHQDRPMTQACVCCLQVFCNSCDPLVKCPETSRVHNTSLLSDSVKVIKTQISQLQSALAEKVARFQSLEKDVYRKIEFIQKEEERLIAHINSTVKEQVDQITHEGECVKAEIRKYTADLKAQAEAFKSQLMTASALVEKGISDLENVTKVSVEGMLIDRFSTLRNDIKELINRSYTPIWIPSKHLVPTGRFRSLEVKLEEVSPCSIDWVNTVRTENDFYYSVRWTSADQLVTGSQGGIEKRGEKLNLISSAQLPDCNDVIPYGDGFIVLQWLRSHQTRKVLLYSQTLEKIKDVVELPTRGDLLSQIAAADERIVASDPENNCVFVYTLGGDLLHTIELSGMTNPTGVCITADGSLLVSDYSVKGSVRKYQLRGDYSLVWQSDELQYPWGIAEDNSGLLYVNRYNTNNSSIYLLSPEGRLLKELACDQLITTTDTHGISVFGDFLAVACRGEGLKLFKFKYAH